MPDVQFKIKGVKRDARSFAQRVSTLWPFFKTRCFRADSVMYDVRRLVWRWRKTLTQLEELNWVGVDSPLKRQYTRNCPPNMVTTDNNKVRRCNNGHICPWCYAEVTGKLFETLAADLPKRGKTNKPITFVEISNRVVIGAAYMGEYLKAQLQLFKKSPQQVIDRLAPLGSFYCVSLSPYTPSEDELFWVLSYRIIAKVESDFVVPEWLNEAGRVVKVSVVSSRRKLCPIVSRTRRYPKGMILADPCMTIKVLKACRNVRLWAFTGCYRGKKG